jgi:hypothetical protein
MPHGGSRRHTTSIIESILRYSGVFGQAFFPIIWIKCAALQRAGRQPMMNDLVKRPHPALLNLL